MKILFILLLLTAVNLPYALVSWAWSNSFDLNTTAIELNRAPVQPAGIGIQACPNPSNAGVTFTFNLPESRSSAAFKIYSLEGKLVRMFTVKQGAHLFWNSLDNSGTMLPSGIYVGKLSHAGKTVTQNLIILR